VILLGAGLVAAACLVVVSMVVLAGWPPRHRWTVGLLLVAADLGAVALMVAGVAQVRP
jgi:hypothetical protein